MTNSRPPRVDARGRAFAGSQLQLQLYVNRRADELSARVHAQLDGLEPGASIRWMSPLEEEMFVEYKDGDFLKKVGLDEHAAALRKFWPRRGPVWDALGVIGGSGTGAVLVEAKSHRNEVRSNGCQAGPRSRPKIEAAFAEAKAWLGVSADADWTGPLYQSANRIAHLYFLREVVGMPAWLVNIYFVNDPHSATTLEEWEEDIDRVKAELGLSEIDVPYMAHVFLEAGVRSELVGDSE